MENESTKIEIILNEGEVNGIVIGQMDNWNGRIYRAGQISENLKRLRENQQIQGYKGVYILSNSTTREVYIGQSKYLEERLTKSHKHLLGESYDQIFVVTTSDNSLTGDDILYLEAKLIALGEETGKVRVRNDQKPDPNKQQSNLGKMGKFIKYLQIVLPLMGLDFIIEVPKHLNLLQSPELPLPLEQPKFVITGKKVKAVMQEIGEQIVVLAESEAVVLSKKNTSYQLTKDILIESKILIKQGEKFVFSKDFGFRSSSEAATIVLGRNANGYISWLLESDRKKTYGIWLEESGNN